MSEQGPDREMIYIQHSEYRRLVAGQSRRASLVEAVANVLIGLGIAVLSNLLVLPLFGLHPTVAEATYIGLIFTVISLARSYVLRRVFNWLHSPR